MVVDGEYDGYRAIARMFIERRRPEVPARHCLPGLSRLWDGGEGDRDRWTVGCVGNEHTRSLAGTPESIVAWGLDHAECASDHRELACRRASYLAEFAPPSARRRYLRAVKPGARYRATHGCAGVKRGAFGSRWWLRGYCWLLAAGSSSVPVCVTADSRDARSTSSITGLRTVREAPTGQVTALGARTTMAPRLGTQTVSNASTRRD